MIIKPGAPTISSHTMVPKIPPFLLFIIIYYYRFWSGKNAGKAGNRENSQRTVISPERGKFGTNFCKTKCFLTSKGSWTEKMQEFFFWRFLLIFYLLWLMRYLFGTQQVHMHVQAAAKVTAMCLSIWWCDLPFCTFDISTEPCCSRH